MSTRYDMKTPSKGADGKTYWTTIGTAWQSDKGIQLVFRALPIPDSEGRCVANLFEPRDPREQSARNDRQQAQGRAQTTAEYIDDELPPF